MRVVKLKTALQNYQWGKKGSDSVIAELIPGDLFDPNLAYAEMWMGTHVNGPSFVFNEETGCYDVSLAEYVRDHPGCLGEGVQDLPFLFKVLSIKDALSIQAHPNKRLAEKLHSEFPDVYRDDNHKPELAIALTPMQALCQFRPIEEIVDHVTNIPQLRTVIGEEVLASALALIDSGDIKSGLKELFSALMKSDPEEIARQLEDLIVSLESRDDKISTIVKRVYDQFPNDVGVFVIYFLNIVDLNPGEAFFIGPDEPHSYLSGDCMECMSCSDNVVRAGCTPKYKDVNTLIEMLTYSTGYPDIFNPNITQNGEIVYSPPVQEFKVGKFLVTSELSVEAITSPTIILVIEGQGSLIWNDTKYPLEKGSCYFIHTNTDYTLLRDTNDMTIFRATINQ